MNYLIKGAALSLLAAGVISISACGEDKKAEPAAQAAAPAPAVTKDSPFEKKAAYAMGASVGTYIGNMLKEQKELIGSYQHDLMVKGFEDALEGKPLLDNEQIAQTLKALDDKAREAAEAKKAKLAADNLANGEKFLAENAKKEGVKTTASGLQYKVITEGKGKSPKPGDLVSVIYKGTTIDGKVFDEQKKPIDLTLDHVIPGWIEGLQLMKEGSVFELYLPAKLAYGENGASEVIAPNSVLQFRVELVSVKHAPKADSAKK